MSKELRWLGIGNVQPKFRASSAFKVVEISTHLKGADKNGI